MSKKRKRQRKSQRLNCWRKVKYENSLDADDKAKELNLDGGGPLVTYFCSCCGYYHIGHIKSGRR